MWFYVKQQNVKRPGLAYVLAAMRAALLCLILLYLAEPTLNLRVTTHPKPALWLLVDGSASMAIEDAPAETGHAATASDPQTPAKKTRLAQVQDVFQRPDDENLLRRLAEKFELRAFTFDRPGEARPLGNPAVDQQEPLDPKRLAAQLTAEGQVTALGDALDDLRDATAPSVRPASSCSATSTRTPASRPRKPPPDSECPSIAWASGRSRRSMSQSTCRHRS
ncbi:MAG: hypothetical protein QM775_34575 [Pirellulales bacterium]